MTAEALETVAEGLAKVDEALKFLNISRGELYDAINDGSLPSVKLDKKRRIPWLALKRYAAAHLVVAK